MPVEFQGFTILHLTDLHSKEYGDGQRNLIELINRQQFDAVAITGDLVDKSNPNMEPAISLVKGLHSKPVFLFLEIMSGGQITKSSLHWKPKGYIYWTTDISNIT